jgi:hypothetical protein
VAECCGFFMSAKDNVVIAIGWFSVQDTTCGGVLIILIVVKQVKKV